MVLSGSLKSYEVRSCSIGFCKGSIEIPHMFYMVLQGSLRFRFTIFLEMLQGSQRVNTVQKGSARFR